MYHTAENKTCLTDDPTRKTLTSTTILISSDFNRDCYKYTITIHHLTVADCNSGCYWPLLLAVAFVGGVTVDPTALGPYSASLPLCRRIWFSPRQGLTHLFLRLVSSVRRADEPMVLFGNYSCSGLHCVFAVHRQFSPYDRRADSSPGVDSRCALFRFALFIQLPAPSAKQTSRKSTRTVRWCVFSRDSVWLSVVRFVSSVRRADEPTVLPRISP